MAGFDVTGWDRGGKVVFHMGVEAPNDVMAVLYATGHLRRTPDGLEAVIKADKVEAHAVARQGRKHSSNSGSTAVIADPMRRKTAKGRRGSPPTYYAASR